MAQFDELKACETEVKRLETRFQDSGSVLACVPVNGIARADMNRHMEEMITSLRSQDFDRHFQSMLETLREMQSRIEAPTPPDQPAK